MKYCTNCNKKFDEDIKFCPECGNKLSVIKDEDDKENDSEIKCPYCGFIQESHFKYCVKCGKNIKTGEVSKDNFDDEKLSKNIDEKKSNYKNVNVLKSVIGLIIMVILSVVFTYSVKNIDVTNNGLNETAIGLSHMNLAVNNFIDKLNIKDMCYTISKYLGFIPFVFVGIFALTGLIQLIKNKSLKKVDFGIYMLLVAYILMVVIYFYYEKNIVNYRPVFESDGTLEASFPSSHTLFSVVLCGTTFILNERLCGKKIIFKSESLCGLVNTLIGILCFVIIVTRTLSGVHWISDIIAGALFGFTILSIYSTLLVIKQ